jgi:hypothetical protein
MNCLQFWRNSLRVLRRGSRRFGATAYIERRCELGPELRDELIKCCDFMFVRSISLCRHNFFSSNQFLKGGMGFRKSAAI